MDAEARIQIAAEQVRRLTVRWRAASPAEEPEPYVLGETELLRVDARRPGRQRSD